MILTEIKPTLRLAFPVIASLLAQVAMEFVDVMMLGRLGADALAAGGLATSIYILVYVFTMGIVLSVGVFVSRGFGANNRPLIISSVQTGLWMALLLSIFGAIIIYYTENFLLLIKQLPTISLLAGDYARAVMWGIPAALGYLVLREYVTAMTMPKVVMFVGVAAIPANAVLNYLLMYGKLGLPELGVAGVGWATTVVDWLIFAAILLYTMLQKKLREYPYWLKLWPIDWGHFAKMIKVGLPIGVSLLSEIGLFSITTLLMGYFGLISLAAHQIAIQCITIIFMIPLGIAQVTAVRIGHAIGANELERVRSILLASILITFIFNCGSGYLFLFHPEQLAGLYIDTNIAQNQAIVKQASIFLGIAVVFQVLDSFQAVANGALRGLKDTFIPMIIALFTYWILGVTCAVGLAFFTPLASAGLWWGLVIGLSFAAVLLLTRFYWKINRLRISSVG